MADVEQGTYSYSKERESLHDQCTDMTSVHPGHDPTYWDPHQTRYSSRTDLLKQQHPSTATWSTDHTSIGTNHRQTHAAFGSTRIKSCSASIAKVVRCRPTELPTQLATLHAGCTSCEPGERVIDPTVRDLHNQDDWSCKSSKAASIRSHPGP